LRTYVLQRRLPQGIAVERAGKLDGIVGKHVGVVATSGERDVGEPAVDKFL
jgi:hypothetical protein